MMKNEKGIALVILPLLILFIGAGIFVANEKSTVTVSPYNSPVYDDEFDYNYDDVLNNVDVDWDF